MIGNVMKSLVAGVQHTVYSEH